MARKAILTTGLLLVLTLPLGSGQGLGTDIVPPLDPVLEAAGDKACDTNGDSEEPFDTQQILASSDWILGSHVSSDGTVVPMATKTVAVGFQSTGKGTLTGRESGDPPADGASVPEDKETEATSEPVMEVENCSSGVCTVQVHVYLNSTTTVKAGVGFWAFLPFFFHIGGEAAVEERVSSYSETKIECTGETFVRLTFSGGVGPQTGAASILATNTKQEQEACTYLNVPDVDTHCTVAWINPFELTASHPGNYTRFDVVNGGRYDIQPAALAAVAIAHTTCVAGVRVYSDNPLVPGVHTNPVCIAGGGEWRAIYKAIEIDVDAEEAMALLESATQGNLPLP
jgi:hypothetical protein